MDTSTTQKSGAYLSAKDWMVTLAVAVLGIAAGGLWLTWRSHGAEQPKPIHQPWWGVAAPDLTVTTTDGRTLKLSELKGKPILLNIWATWCPPCVAEIPSLMKLRKETAESDLVILGISREESAVLEQYVKDNHINYTVASLPEPPPPFDELKIPATFFIDRNGIITHAALGYCKFDFLKTQALAPNYAGPAKAAPPTPAP